MLAALANIELGLGADQRAPLGPVPLVVVDALDGLLDLGEALPVVLLYPLRHEGEIFRVQEEIAGQDVARQQIHHLRLPVRRRRAGRGDLLQIEHDDARRAEIELVGAFSVGKRRIRSSM